MLRMIRFAKWVCFFSIFFLVLAPTSNEQEDGKTSLLSFVNKLSNGNTNILGWNLSSDPCNGGWNGIKCDTQNVTIKKIFLDDQSFNGTFDAYLLCNPSNSLADSLIEINVNNNTLSGENLDQIHNCRQLVRLHLGSNKITGTIPESFSTLKNLVWLDLSENGFTGGLPNLSGISCLQVFEAQGNQFTGGIPFSDFSNFHTFNVSFNNLSGQIPDGANGNKLDFTSFMSNPQLCGDPLPNKCLSSPVSSPENDRHKKSKNVTAQFLMYSGYFVIGLAILVIILIKLCKKGKKQEQSDEKLSKGKRTAAISDDSLSKPSEMSGLSKTELSAWDESGAVMSSTMIIVSSPVVNGLRFEDLLKAPAELLGRGKHGSVYMVTCDQGIELVVKRVKDWRINGIDFRRRMKRLGEVKHPNVLSAMAFYSCRQEKLIVYEYHQNGSLFRLLHGTKDRNFPLNWINRLNIAAAIGDALAFMHRELHRDGIPHGNLKSSNILMKKNLEPCISEYGLMEDELGNGSFKGDVYSYGMILLELLTGKNGQANGAELARWVVSVVREEWTGEVFDRVLMEEGASEERMVNMLQIAIKCVSETEEARPNMYQVALMINGLLKQDDESSIISEP